MRAAGPAALDALRSQVRALELREHTSAGVLPFGVSLLDAALPGGGLALGALHEVAAGGSDMTGAAAALFAAGILARRPGTVLWCIAHPDLFAPALSQAGLTPDRVIYVEVADEAALLGCFEEALRYGGLAGVVCETGRLTLTASRRLQLVAEGSGAIGLIVRRWRRAAQAADFGQATAATTRWRIGAEPSAPLPVPGVGRARWRVELLRCRGADAADFILDACDETGRLALPAELADRSSASTAGLGRAAA